MLKEQSCSGVRRTVMKRECEAFRVKDVFGRY